MGISLEDQLPDANKFCDFYEIVANKGIINEIFIQLRCQLIDQGLIMNNGSLVVASIVDSPVQRDTREENEKIKYGEKPEGWKGNKTSQKDLDAVWTKRSMESIGMAIKILSKLIRKVS